MEAFHIDVSISTRIPMPQDMSPTSKQVQQTMLKDFLQQVIAISLPKEEVLILNELFGTTEI